MTTMELRADIFENLNFLLDNEEAMTQLKNICKAACEIKSNGTALVNMTLAN